MSPVIDPSDEELAAQETRLVFPTFDNTIGIELGIQLVEEAKRQGLAVTIDVRRGDQQVFHAARPGTTADNDAWVQRKVNVVRRFEMSSFRLGCQLRAAGKTITEAYLLDESTYASHGGAFPIRVTGAGLVGVVTVSGLPQREDHALVVQVLSDFLANHLG